GDPSATAAASSDVPPAVPTTVNVPPTTTSFPTDVSAGVSNKGKSPMMQEDILVKHMTFRQMEEDRLGEEAAKRLNEEEQANLER
ncbi:hypothetical protein Tco_0612104, partial [Tanacetum coccineum]